MTTTAVATSHGTGVRPAPGAYVQRVFDWLAGWADRHIPEGEDGTHIPENVRRMIAHRNFYV